MKPDANHAHDHAPTETDADDARARYDDGVRVAAPPRCGKCGIHPVATVTEKTRPDETTWCISCRRISTMTINGSASGRRAARASAESKAPKPTPAKAAKKPKVKPAAASPATPATGEPVEVVHVAAAPAPLDLPPRTLDEERVRFEATMRGLNDAGRALAVAKKVGGVENLEALVTRALLLAL